MNDCTRWSLAQQIDWFRKQFAQDGGTDFSQVLTRESVCEAMQAVGLRFFNSLYNPVTVLWLFLGQVTHANPTLATTVENFLAWRLGQGLPPCSSDTGAYSRARGRLPERLLARLTQPIGRKAEEGADNDWRWLGRSVKVFDGSTVSMPDTPKNQAAYPQPKSQSPGIGFPLARIGVLFSLSVGTVLDLQVRRWAGKFQSELGMLRAMFAQFTAGDVLLTDRYLCSYMEIALLQCQGVDFVGRMHAQRHVDFRRGRQIGQEDHLVWWTKPSRPEWMSPGEYAALPAGMWMRELRYSVERDGYRPVTLVIATTLLDSETVSWESIAELYALRWDAEVNLRSLKTMMQMDVLRCLTSEMVRKEIWAHLLAYNLIRAVIAQAAVVSGKPPRQISFTRAMRTLEAFRSTLAHARDAELPNLYQHLLRAIASHEITNRPGRLEPRQRKRRPKPDPYMTKPRSQARKRYAKRR